MAKIFYTLEEAAQKLGKSPDEVKQLVSNGQLQEFRDRDRLMFKRDQVDLLSGGAESISLVDDLEPISLASSGSGSAIDLADDTKEGTGGGISIFDVTEEADPNSKTVMSAGATAPDFSIDPSTSGSGLLNLTREADDTGLGEDLLQDVYGQSEQAIAAPTGELFETTTAVSDISTSAPVGSTMVVVAPVEGAASGLAGGAALGMVLGLLAVMAVVIMALTGIGAGAGASGGTGGLLDTVAKNHMAIVGGIGGAIVVFALLGMVIGKKTA